jgi:predicted nucleic acid-binding protein
LRSRNAIVLDTNVLIYQLEKNLRYFPLSDAVFAWLDQRTTYPSLAWLPPDLAIADTAAQLRAAYRLRTPDAIQAATAIRAKVSTLFANDPIFQRVKEIGNFCIRRSPLTLLDRPPKMVSSTTQ